MGKVPLCRDPREGGGQCPPRGALGACQAEPFCVKSLRSSYTELYLQILNPSA